MRLGGPTPWLPRPGGSHSDLVESLARHVLELKDEIADKSLGMVPPAEYEHHPLGCSPNRGTAPIGTARKWGGSIMSYAALILSKHPGLTLFQESRGARDRGEGCRQFS